MGDLHDLLDVDIDEVVEAVDVLLDQSFHLVKSVGHRRNTFKLGEMLGAVSICPAC